MKRNVPAWSGFAMALLVPMWLLSVSAAAQSHGSSGGSSSSSGGGASSSGGGGGGGDGSSSTGTSHASSGGGSSSGTAVSRDSGGSSGSSGGGVSSSGSVGSTRGGSDGTLIAGGSGGGGRAHAGYRGDGTARSAGDPVPPYARPRGDRPATGEYTPRTGAPPVPGGRGTGGGVYLPTGYYGGYYPYGYGGLGFGSYYGYYDPWYDPFYGGFGSSGYGGYGYGGSYGGSQYSPSSGEEGSLRLKIKPRDASVFVDGYYVGLVDDFDGIFQKLNIEAGPHRVEIRAPGYETLSFEVRLVPDHTTTYTGELKKIQ
jgi:PEGA domain